VTDDETRGLVERFYAVLWNAWDDGAVDGLAPTGRSFPLLGGRLLRVRGRPDHLGVGAGDLDGLRRQLSPG
jgi:hypothetical protein